MGHPFLRLNMDKNLFIEFSVARASVYAFFSFFFSNKRTQEVLDTWPVVKKIILLEADIVQGVDKEITVKESPIKAGSEIEVEFAKLFYGVGQKTISLNESMYRSDSGLFCPSTQNKVNKIYAEAGKSVAKDLDLAADSLPVQMAFVSSQLSEGEDPLKQKDLILNHIVPLGICIANQVINSSGNKDIKNICEGLKLFCENEKAAFSKLE